MLLIGGDSTDISGFQLDKRHMIAPLKDDNETKYYLFTYQNDIDNNKVDGTEFAMEEIDMENFMWNGKSLRLEVN